MLTGLTMDGYPLTLTAVVERAERFHGHRHVVTRRPDGNVVRTTLGECAHRARRLATALRSLGVGDGDRVATLMWNQHEHLEVYLAVPPMGALIHTLNPRLHAEELGFIASDAEDSVIVVDGSLLEVFATFQAAHRFRHVIVVGQGGGTPGWAVDYETLVASHEPAEWQVLDERRAAAMCYTSGTTGRPKGVVYSHRSLVLHSMTAALPDQLGVSSRDVILPVVPMFHANAWGLPYATALTGAAFVLPGPRLDPVSVLEGFDRHGLSVIQAWGMTEMAPLGSVCRQPAALDTAEADERYNFRARQGIASPFVEIRARDDEGRLIAWDDEAMGELEVRGPWVAASYHRGRGVESFTDDGWFRTGDIVRIDVRGCIRICDRAKDLVKSGGEWISSVDLENHLMAHPSVAQAAVIAIPDERWGERPLAVVAKRDGCEVSAEQLREHLSSEFASWQLPDRFEFVAGIPTTATGKFKKTALRETFTEH